MLAGILQSEVIHFDRTKQLANLKNDVREEKKREDFSLASIKKRLGGSAKRRRKLMAYSKRLN